MLLYYGASIVIYAFVDMNKNGLICNYSFLMLLLLFLRFADDFVNFLSFAEKELTF